MRKDEIFGGREQESLKALGPATMYVLNAMKPTLDRGLEAQSVINNSLDVINNSNVNTAYSTFDNMNNFDVNSDMANSSFSQGQSESRAKVRVLTPGNNSVSRSGVSEINNSSSNSRNYYYSSAEYNDNVQSSGNVFGNIGSVQTLILIFTAILVVMVILVSLVIMNYLGL